MTLVLSLTDVQWGTDGFEQAPNARRLNLMDPNSGIVVQVVFADEPLEKLILEMAQGLTDAQKQTVIAELTSQTSGLIIPNGNAKVPPEPEKS